MNILRAEWRRFFARRFTRIMLLIVVALMAAVAIGLAVDSHKPSAASLASAQQQVDQIAAQQRADLAGCTAAQNGGPDPDGRYQLPPDMTCDDAFGAFDLNVTDFMPHEWIFRDQAGDVIMLFGALLALFGFAAGASYIGAEWSSGGMMNLLLWKPRRLNMLTAKLTALVTSVFASGVALLAIWIGMLCAVAAGRGAFGHATAGAVRSFGLLGLRAVVVGLVAAVIGFGLASVGRNTVTALATAIGYLLLFEGAGHLVFDQLLRVGQSQRYFLSSYVAAWLEKKQNYTVVTCPPATGRCTEKSWSIHMGQAATVVGVLLAVILVWAFTAFKRRDVT